MTTEAEKKAVWEAMLESEYQRRYWHAKGVQFIQREQWLTIFIALLSLSTLALAFNEWGLGTFWKVASVIAASLACAQPFLQYSRQSWKMLDVSIQWHEVEIKYEEMWRSIETSFPENKFNTLKGEGVKISRSSADLPHNDKKIQKTCYEQVLVERGLKS